MYFTSPLEIPENLIDTIVAQQKDTKEGITNGSTPQLKYIDVAVVRQDELDDDVSEPILFEWTLTQLNSEGLTIDLEFERPLLISQDDDPDLLIVQLELSEFKDANGKSLPQSLVKQIMIPPQFADKEEAENIESAAESTKAATLGSTLSFTIT